MIKMSKEEYDRLMETSPNIPEKIITQFKTNFNKSESFQKIVKPEICDILIPTNEQRNPWYNEENRTKEANIFLKNKILKQHKISKAIADNNKIVSEFVTTFKHLNNREPMESEIIDNLKDKLDIEQIKKVISSLNTLSLQINVDNDDPTLGLNIV